MIKILMIEDDCELATLLARLLTPQGINTTIANDPNTGLELLDNGRFDALVLDLGLPDMDGLEVCERVRRVRPNLPIIISSARGETLDKIKGFEGGADDYLVKPYEPVELAFRLRAILRRGIAQSELARIFSIDADRRVVLKNGAPLKLSRAEYDIFAYLAEREGLVVSREDLLMSVNSVKFASGLKSIDVIIGRLRAKIGDDPKQPRLIHAIRGVGYKFENADS